MGLTTATVAGLHARLTCPFEAFKEHRRPLLLIHGAWSASWIFEESGWLKKFGDAGFAACAIDLPGHGQSGSAKRLSDLRIEDHVIAIRAVFRELDFPPGKLNVLGHSLGSLITQKVVGEAYAAKVVLLSSPLPKPCANISLPFALRSWKYPEILFGQTMLFRPVDAIELIGSDMERGTITAALKQLQPESSRIIRQLAFWGVPVPKLACPTLVVGGTNDLLLPKRVHARLAAYHGAQLQLFDAGHAPMFEATADAVFTSITSWLHS